MIIMQISRSFVNDPADQCSRSMNRPSARESKTDAIPLGADQNLMELEAGIRSFPRLECLWHRRSL